VAKKALEESEDTVEFEATIPLLQSAISIGGDGGARVKLDIAESDIAAVKRLMDLRGEVLKVVMKVE
jgi:hypothetical protein